MDTTANDTTSVTDGMILERLETIADRSDNREGSSSAQVDIIDFHTAEYDKHPLHGNGGGSDEDMRPSRNHRTTMRTTKNEGLFSTRAHSVNAGAVGPRLANEEEVNELQAKERNQRLDFQGFLLDGFDVERDSKPAPRYPFSSLGIDGVQVLTEEKHSADSNTLALQPITLEKSTQVESDFLPLEILTDPSAACDQMDSSDIISPGEIFPETMDSMNSDIFQLDPALRGKVIEELRHIDGNEEIFLSEVQEKVKEENRSQNLEPMFSIHAGELASARLVGHTTSHAPKSTREGIPKQLQTKTSSHSNPQAASMPVHAVAFRNIDSRTQAPDITELLSRKVAEKDSKTGKRGSYACGLCGTWGHNSRTCNENKSKASSRLLMAKGIAKHTSGPKTTLGRKHVCGICYQAGHNVRTHHLYLSADNELLKVPPRCNFECLKLKNKTIFSENGTRAQLGSQSKNPQSSIADLKRKYDLIYNRILRLATPQ